MVKREYSTLKDSLNKIVKVIFVGNFGVSLLLSLLQTLSYSITCWIVQLEQAIYDERTKETNE